jgi:hypothetical protein
MVRIPQYLFLLALVARFSMCLCSESFGQSSDEFFVNETAFCLVDPKSNRSPDGTLRTILDCPSDKRFRNGASVKISELPSPKIYFWSNVKRIPEKQDVVEFLFARRGKCYESDREIEQKLQKSITIARRVKSGQAAEEVRNLRDSTPGQMLEFAASFLVKNPLAKFALLGVVKFLPVPLEPADGNKPDVNVSDFRGVGCEGEFAARIFDKDTNPLAGHNDIKSIKIDK